MLARRLGSWYAFYFLLHFLLTYNLFSVITMNDVSPWSIDIRKVWKNYGMCFFTPFILFF